MSDYKSHDANHLAMRLKHDTVYDVIVYPDHPYLMTTPDILLVKDGVLILVFLLRRSISDLRYRIASSRLVFPPHTLMMLFAPERMLSAHSSELEQTVDFHVSSYNELRSLIQEPPAPRVNSSQLLSIQKRAFAKSQIILSYVSLDVCNRAELGSKVKRKRLRGGETGISLPPIEQEEGTRTITIVHGSDLTSVTRKTREFLSSYTAKNYAFDNLIPYSRSHKPVYAMFDVSPLASKRDPFKYPRAMSIHGWVPVCDGPGKAFERTADELESVLESESLL